MANAHPRKRAPPQTVPKKHGVILGRNKFPPTGISHARGHHPAACAPFAPLWRGFLFGTNRRALISVVSSFALSPDGGETYVSRSLSLVVASSIFMTAATARLAAG
jgi:hypothetical protein